MKQLAILISDTGTGTNLQAIIDAIKQHTVQAEIAVVISDTADAKGVEHTKKHNVPVIVCKRGEDLLNLLRPNTYSSSDEHREGPRRRNVILSTTKDLPAGRQGLRDSSASPQNDNTGVTQTIKYPVDYVCLCGWKQIISDTFIKAFPDKILNLHPGVIPDTMGGVVKNPDGSHGLWNKGKLTNAAIQNVLDSKATYSGSSIHFLTDEFDFGPVLGRTFEKVQQGDTVDMLYKRLKKKENKLYVEVLQKLCNS